MHLQTNNILKDSQHGFRNQRGTDTALTTIHETIAHMTAKKTAMLCHSPRCVESFRQGVA